MSSSSLPPPSAQVLSLLAALSTPENHELHVQAIQASEQALKASLESYTTLCLQLAVVLIGSDHPEQMMHRMHPTDLEIWTRNDFYRQRLQNDTSWIAFGQRAGLVLKNALAMPPILQGAYRPLCITPEAAVPLQQALLQALYCRHAPLRKVASSILAAVGCGEQPALHLQSWTTLLPNLIQRLQQGMNSTSTNPATEGALSTIQKIMEDEASLVEPARLDELVPILVHFLSSTDDTFKIGALQTLQFCLMDNVMPSALVLVWERYLSSLSALATDPNPVVRKWVCRSIVLLLQHRVEYLRQHFAAVAQFILTSTSDRAMDDLVALEACEFWLVFCTLDQVEVTKEMRECVAQLLPQLVPILLTVMVYGPEQQAELLMQNELDLQQNDVDEQKRFEGGDMRPLFHKSKAQLKYNEPNNGFSDNIDENEQDDGYERDDEGDDNDVFDDDEDGNSWTLRKCAAASLDSLAESFSSDILLPCLLPSLQEGLSSSDSWIQEASILALGAIAEGCHDAMEQHMDKLYPYLMNLLATPEREGYLPQVKCIAAWTISRYSGWAIGQVQSGTQGHLLAQMTETFLTRLQDRHRKVQHAVCSSFGSIVEVAGDLMVPYLRPMFEALVGALSRYQGRSLVLVFDTISVIADYCGPAISEGELLPLYVNPILQLWDQMARRDPSNRLLLPLMECLASIALTSSLNFEQYALRTFENSMCIIEMMTLELSAAEEKNSNEEDYDPITCAADLLDSLVEGLQGNFTALVASSQRYGPHFLSVLHALCRHDIPGVRMSGLALLGDLARNDPAILQPALPRLLKEAVSNMDPGQPGVCSNAVWSTGEICIRCKGNPSLLQPFAVEIVQNLLGLLSGNGGEGNTFPGLVENSAACLGRLAVADPTLVAGDVARLLMGWCDGLAKVTDPTERHDAFEGFVKAIYANPSAIQEATANVSDAVVAIIFCIITWHMPMDLPEESTSLLYGEYRFLPFPVQEAELGKALAQLLRDVKGAIGDDTWFSVTKSTPVNVRRLLRETYQL